MSQPEDRSSETPGPTEDTEFRPVKIPNLRKRAPLWRRALFGLGVLAVGVAVVAGCLGLHRWSQKNEVEKIVRRGFEEKLKQSVTAIDLTRQAEGEYRGSLTTTDGEEWLVSASVQAVSGGRQVRWKVRPSQARAEAEVRKHFEETLNARVRRLQVTRQEDGRYGGTVELETGEQFDLVEEDEGSPHLFRFEWTQATLERWVREQAKLIVNDNLVDLKLGPHGRGAFRGQAKGESGLDYLILLDPQTVEGKERTRLRIHPPPEQYGRWVKRGMEHEMAAKVKSIELKPRTQGDHAGVAVLTNGEVYDVRVGTPPGWRGTPQEGEITYRFALQPASYEAWVKNGLEERFKMKVTAIKLKRHVSGEYGGTAQIESGHRYQIRAGVLKKDKQNPPKPEWPDLGPEQVEWEASRE